ncbi:MAG: phage virion morphogenesis protein [Alphaproteobacteria bacterium]|nr:phage virion morphogenesis protein [Alphaproteobacteria bacterium]
MDGASIRYHGDKKILKLLDKLVSPQMRQQLLDAIAAYGVSSTHQRFLDQTGPDGVKWKKSRRAESTGGQTLRLTARLFQSLVSEATPTSAAWGTNVAYAGIHQLGGVIKAKSAEFLTFRGLNGGFTRVKQVVIPARPYLGISAMDSDRIDRIAGDWVEGMAQ